MKFTKTYYNEYLLCLHCEWQIETKENGMYVCVYVALTWDRRMATTGREKKEEKLSIIIIEKIKVSEHSSGYFSLSEHCTEI